MGKVKTPLPQTGKTPSPYFGKCGNLRTVPNLIGVFFVKSDGEDPRSRFEQEDGQTDSETKARERL